MTFPFILSSVGVDGAKGKVAKATSPAASSPSSPPSPRRSSVRPNRGGISREDSYKYFPHIRQQPLREGVFIKTILSSLCALWSVCECAHVLCVGARARVCVASICLQMCCHICQRTLFAPLFARVCRRLIVFFHCSVRLLFVLCFCFFFFGFRGDTSV